MDIFFLGAAKLLCLYGDRSMCLSEVVRVNNSGCAAGLVLMNSAGKIEPSWVPEQLEAKNAFVPPRLLVDLLSRGLFL